jgi:hypothetical protein
MSSSERQDNNREGVEDKQPEAGDDDIERQQPAGDIERVQPVWSRRLLLIMGSAIFVIVISLPLIRLNIQESQEINIKQDLDYIDKNAEGDAPNKLEYTKWKTRAIFESNSLQHRHHVIHENLIAQAWYRSLGFVVGVLLLIVGTKFVFERSKGNDTKFEYTDKSWKPLILITSPGLILVLIGALLLISSMFITTTINWNDSPLYIDSPDAHSMPND